MKLVRALLGSALAIAMILTPAYAGNKNINTARGFNGRVYNSVFALYGSSAASGIQDRFVCTVTAYQQVSGGYLLIGAGHCTSANAESLPSDMTYSVSEELGGKLTPVALLKSEMDEPLDYAVYFMPTKQKYPVLALGDETKDRIGDKTIDVNFSLAAAKMFSPGTIVSQVITTQTEVRGFFLIDQFDSHGASGSSVVSEKTHKIIGLVIAGWDGETMPSVVEPITSILPHIQDAQALALVAASKPIPVTVLPPTPPQDPNDSDDLYQRANSGMHQGGQPGGNRGGETPGDHRGNGEVRGGDRGDNRGDRDGRRDGRTYNRNEHHRINRQREVRVVGRHEQIFFGGFWWACDYDWPVWVWDGDVYMVMVGDNIYEMYSYDDPNLEIAIYVVE